METAILIPLYPLGSFLLLLLLGRRLKEYSAFIGIVLLLATFIHSIFILLERFVEPTFKREIVWLTIGDIQLTAGYEINQLNALMLVIVSFISLIVHIYSKAYMSGEQRFSTFYAYLVFFRFDLLGVVIYSYFLFIYMFWVFF